MSWTVASDVLDPQRAHGARHEVDAGMSVSSAAPNGRVLPIICGPTAAGKSAVAMTLAASAPVTIISADSRQIYRGFDIGTAKPSADDRARVPHVGIDVAEPTARWSAWQWAEMAHAAIAEAWSAHRVPMVVGGTGFYIRALLHPLAAIPPLDPERRTALHRWLDAMSHDQLRQWTERLDPPRAAFGPAQWRRAIEVALLTGRPLSSWYRAGEEESVSTLRSVSAVAGGAAAVAAEHPQYVPHVLLVDPGPPLRERIAERVDAMLTAGWVDEVQRLQRAVPADAPAWNATGYGDLVDYLAGVITRTDARERVIAHTRQYAKRQRTWFRHQLDGVPVQMVDPLADDAADTIGRWWRALEGSA